MKYLEQLILGSCYGEDQLKRVSFLEPSDFTLKIHSQLYSAIKSEGGMIQAVSGNHVLKDVMIGYSSMMGTYKPETFAIYLLECRFKILLSVLLVKLSEGSNNPLEVAILDEAVTKIKTVDVFDLSDYLLEYLGHQSSPPTRHRINAFLKYRDERISNVKKVINEY